MSGYAFLMFGDFIFSLLIFRPSCFYIILWLPGNIKYKKSKPFSTKHAIIKQIMENAV